MDKHTLLNKDNGVKGVDAGERPAANPANPSPGTGVHDKQVTLDRHHATAYRKSNMRIGTWNVRTLHQLGKLENVEQEMDRLKVNILGLCETRWEGAGRIQTEDHTFVYSGGDKHERGVGILLDKFHSKCLLGYWAISDRVMLAKLKGHPFDLSIIQAYAPTSESTDEELDTFYESLDKARQQCKSQEVILTMGDFNAKVGEGKETDIVGMHGLGVRNERGEKFIEWCNTNNQVIANTFYQNHPRRKWTWKSPGDIVRNQIDYITINRRFRNAITQAVTYPGADCGSDHVPVVANIRLILRKLQKPKNHNALDYSQLYKDNTTKEQYAISVQNRFNALHVEERFTWSNFRTTLVEAAEETVPKKERRTKSKWMTAEILKKMEDRQKITKGSQEYKELDSNIKIECKEAKEKWLNAECDKIEEDMQHNNMHGMHKKIKELTGSRSCTSNGCIRAKDGTIIVKKEDVMNRWTEYIKELFQDNRGGKPIIRKPMDGPTILKSEVKAAISKIKRNKAKGPDGIVIEMIQALDDLGIESVTNIANRIYDTGEIPDDLTKSVFIALPKKAGTIECELHRTISLMSHIIKIILHILLRRAKNRIDPEIPQEQCGFTEDTGTRNAIFMLRMLSERAIEMQRDVYICFIDYTKAFDKVRHEELLEMLQNLDIDGKDIRVIRNIYWDQAAAISIDNELTQYTSIERGVRQGCVFSAKGFNLYGEIILRELEPLRGISIGGYNINNIRYADDTTLIADSEENLQDLLDTVVNKSEEKGLSINIKKTECMVMSKKKDTPVCNLFIHGKQVKQVNSFKYLGSTVTSDGKSDCDIKKRIAIAKDSFSKMSSILKNGKLAMKTRLRVLNCYVFSVLKYGSECWTISKAMENRLQAAELWFYRRMLRLRWTDRVTNVEVLRRIGQSTLLLKTIRQQQLKFLCHIMRKDGLEKTILTGKIEGNQDRGRQDRHSSVA